MLPNGATPLKGAASQPYAVTLTAPGLYGVRCRPHYAMGMVGVIVVGGKPANLAQAQAVTVPGMAKARMDGLLTQAAAVTEPKAKKAGKAHATHGAI
jgi:pseudoazurin